MSDESNTEVEIEQEMMIDLPLEDLGVEDTSDGGAVIFLQENITIQKDTPWFENILENVDTSMLKTCVSDL